MFFFLLFGHSINLFYNDGYQHVDGLALHIERIGQLPTEHPDYPVEGFESGSEDGAGDENIPVNKGSEVI